MEQWKKDGRRDVVIVDLEALVPKDHLLRKREKVMDYDWLYERSEPYYCHDNGRPGTDPVVLIQHLFGIVSLRQTYREIQLNKTLQIFEQYCLLTLHWENDLRSTQKTVRWFLVRWMKPAKSDWLRFRTTRHQIRTEISSFPGIIFTWLVVDCGLFHLQSVPLWARFISRFEAWLMRAFLL